jgi:serine/threonine protein kinase
MDNQEPVKNQLSLAPPVAALPTPPERKFVPPAPGEIITSFLTRNTYVIGTVIGEGHFGVVYSCTDNWNNELAVKVLKPLGMPYEKVKAAAEAEFVKLVALRHPSITYIPKACSISDFQRDGTVAGLERRIAYDTAGAESSNHAMNHRSTASFGKRQEYVAVAELLRRGFDVYMTLVDDEQIDCINRAAENPSLASESSHSLLRNTRRAPNRVAHAYAPGVRRGA